VREAVRGKSRAEADAALQALQAQGVIGDYSLPEGVRQLPRFDWQLSIQGR
jgi:kynureninase